MSTQTTWEQPLISVDVVAVKFDKADNGRIKFFVSRRTNAPYAGELALPGVLLSHERVSEAAVRALTTKIGVKENDIRIVRDIGISDNPDRDPRGATLSIINLAVIEDSFIPLNEDVELVSVYNLDTFKLPFDHTNLIRKALSQLESLLMNDKEMSKALLGDEFRTTDLHSLYSQLVDVAEDSPVVPDLSNLSRRLKNTNGIQSKEVTVTSLASSGRGRPSSVWTWV